MRERDTDVVTEEFRAAALQKAKGNYQMTQLHQSRESTQRSPHPAREIPTLPCSLLLYSQCPVNRKSLEVHQLMDV